MYASETGRENGQTASGETIREIPRTPEVVTKVDASVEVFVDYPYADDARTLVPRAMLSGASEWSWSLYSVQQADGVAY